MATNYPNSKQTFTDYTAGAVITSVDLNAVRDTVEAIEDKVGVNGSTDVNSLTYKVENASSVNPGHKHSVSGLSATGTASSTTFLRGDNTWATPVSASDASTTVKGISKLSVAPAVANDPIAVGTNDPRLGDANYVSKGLLRVQDSATISGLNISGGVLSVNSGTGANQIVRLNASSQLPAVDGSLLTNLPSPVSKTYGAGTLIDTSITQTMLTLAFPAVPVGKTAQIRFFGKLNHYTTNDTVSGTVMTRINGVDIFGVGSSFGSSSSHSECATEFAFTLEIQPNNSTNAKVYSEAYINGYIEDYYNRNYRNLSDSYQGGYNASLAFNATSANTLTIVLSSFTLTPSAIVKAVSITII